MKLPAFCATVFLFIALLSGCVSEKKKIDQLSDMKGAVIGMISSGISEEGVQQMTEKLTGVPVGEIVFFNRGIDVVAALKAGKIDAAPMHQFAADYFLKRNDDLKMIPVEQQFEGGVIMALREEDQRLKARLDSAISLMDQNGTTQQLREKWIDNLSADEPARTEMVKTDGAPTVYVGVTGDYPPLDYVAADGLPSGFNVAFLNEAGKILNLNFELVPVETQAKFAALLGKKIDIIFCHFKSSDSRYFDELKSNSWIATIPYFTYKNGSFAVRK